MDVYVRDAELSVTLAHLPELARRASVEEMSTEDLATLLEAIRSAQAALESLVVRLGSRADALAAAGESAPADELLRNNGRVRAATARAEATRSRLAAQFPALRQAMNQHNLGADQLDTLARHTRRLSETDRARLAIDDLAAAAQHLPADTFDALVKREVEVLAPTVPQADADEARAASEFRHWFDERSGMGQLRGALDPERYEALTTAVDQHTAALAADAGDGETTKNANLAAAALFELVTQSGARRARHPHLVVVVDGEEAQTGDGRDLTPHARRRLSCDATVQQVTLDHTGLPINVGRRYRTATGAQWTAIQAIHATCAWEGCRRPLSHCQLHHLRPWSDGGTTDLDNLVPLCSRHHHRVHEGRWQIELRADRSLIISRPDGAIHTTTDPPRRRNSGVLVNGVP